MGPTCRGKVGRSDSGKLLGDAPVLVGVPPLLEAGLICRRLDDGREACNVPEVVVRGQLNVRLDGFSWGNDGLGAENLALNALWAIVPEHAYALCQGFKRRFIEPLPREGGHIPIEDIREWIIGQLVAA